MEAILIEYKYVIFVLVVAIIFYIFRKELNKIIDWVVTFKRVAKTKDGYAASVTPEASGAPQPDDGAKDKKESVLKELRETETAPPVAEPDWFNSYYSGDYDGASEILLERIKDEQDPKKRFELECCLGQVYVVQDEQKGVDYFEKILKTKDTAATCYGHYALGFSFAGNYTEAQKVLSRGIRAFPDEVLLLVQQGSNLHRQGLHEEAADILLSAINRYPKEVRSYATLAMLLAELEMKEEAITCCQVGLALCPPHTVLIEKYIDLFSGNEASKERMSGYMRLSEICEDNSSYWALLGNEYLHHGFNDLALEAYKRGETLADEKEAWILSNIGNILINQGFLSHGAEYLQRALAIDPESQYSHERLAIALKLEQEQKEACNKMREEVRMTIRADQPLDGILEKVRKKMSQQSWPDKFVIDDIDDTLDEEFHA